jgi:hypothetical protein
MKFQLNQIYTEELPVTFGDLSDEQLSVTFSDGRAAAFLIYEHLLARHENLLRAMNYPADCVKLAERVLQVRMVTANGTALNPHKQNGTRRQYNQLEHLEARNSVDGYILVDITEFPTIVYSFVPITRVPMNARFSCEDAQSLISLATGN